MGNNRCPGRLNEADSDVTSCNRIAETLRMAHSAEVEKIYERLAQNSCMASGKTFGTERNFASVEADASHEFESSEWISEGNSNSLAEIAVSAL